MLNVKCEIKKIFIRMRCISLLLGLLWCMEPVSVLAQINTNEKVIVGTVKDVAGEPVIGVSIKLKGGTTGGITDLDGKYSIQVKGEAGTLIYSYIGYTTEEKDFDKNTRSLDVILREDTEMLDEVVVVGYGTMKKKDLTGSVTRIGKEVTENKAATNLVEFLRGTVAGFNSSLGNTASGGGTMEIRGPNSLKANTEPLVVLDGSIYYGLLQDINPSDVESIDVLKDASSSAIYGARGAAGVIMVTTKRGKSEKPLIQVSTRVGLTSVGKMAKAYSPAGYLRMRSDYYKTKDYFAPEGSKKPSGYYDDPNNLPSGISKEQWAGYDPSFSGDYTETWLNRIALQPIEIENYKKGLTTDWLDEVFRTGLKQDYNVSVSGKTNRTNYFLSMGYVDNEGVKVGDDYSNVRSRVNIDTEITNWLTVGVNAQFANRTDGSVPIDLTSASKASPYGMMYEADGSLKWYPHDYEKLTNPFIYTYNRDKFNKTQTLLATLFAEIKLPFGFSYKVSYQNRYGWGKEYYYDPSTIPFIVDGGFAYRRDYSVYEWMVDNILKWNKTFNKIHNFDVTLVANVEKYEEWSSRQQNSGFAPNGNLGFHNMSAGLNPELNTDDQAQTGNAFLGRLNYTLKDRYMFTASVRRDGFSAFGQSNPYATFPAFAAAWRISEENFLENNKVIDNLKLRVSWGMNGNREFGRYEALARLKTTKNIIGGETVTGVWTENLANSRLKWEKTASTNVGLDFGLFGNRLYGTFDFYKTKTTDLLLTRALPDIIGYSTVADNMGEVSNIGAELTLNSVNIDISKKIRWTSTFIYSSNKNKIKHLYGNQVEVLDNEGNIIGQREADDETNGWYIGHGVHDIYDYKFVGVWQLGEEEEASKYGKTPGDPKLLDVNEDGVIDSKNDRVWLGSKTPKFRMSLRNEFMLFDCLNVSFLLRGEFNYWGAFNYAKNDDSRQFNIMNTYSYDYWTPDNPTNSYCKLGSNSKDPDFNVWKKRDYIRLQDLSISYTFPKKILRKLSIEGLKVSAMMENGFVITGWKHYDPELEGIVPRNFTFGVNITL